MIVAYALGGGLGHLTRVRAAIHTLSLDDQPLTIITSRPGPADPRVVGGADVIVAPPALARDAAGLEHFVRTTVAALAPSEIVLDAFPAGILGELGPQTFPTGVPVRHLARALRWDRYAPHLPPSSPRSATTYVLEPLTPAHRQHLEAHSDRVGALELVDPPGPARDAQGDALVLAPDPQAPDRPLWLVVHGGPVTEQHELVEYARAQAVAGAVDPRVVLVAPGLPGADVSLATTEGIERIERVERVEQVEQVDAYPARPLFAAAERIFTAGGFNAMRDAAAFRDRHHPLPFERRYDDQFARVRRATQRRP